MHGQNPNHHLIEYILNLLQFFRENQLDTDQLAEHGLPEEFLSLPDAQYYQVSYEMVKFMEEMPGGFFIYYADGGEEIIYANQALLRIFQCDTMAEFREWTGNSFRGLVHPDDLETVEQSIRTQVFSSQHDLDYVEYRIIRKDGMIRWIEDYGHFVRRESFRDIFYVFISDATEKQERHQAEKESLIDEKRREQQKLQDLIAKYDQERSLINQEYLRRMEVIEGLSINYESIFYVDLDENKILPYRLSIRSKPLFDGVLQMRSYTTSVSDYSNAWVHPEDRETFTKTTSPAFIHEKLKDSRTYYINYRVLDGEEIQYLQLRIVNVGHHDQVMQLVMGFRRVDEELQHEIEQKEMLAEALNNAKQAIDAKTIFLSNMSHDMRTPLNAIFGFTTLAKRNCEDPGAVRNYLERIETSSRQLLDLINKVLELSKTESGEISTVEVECDLCETLQEIYDFLQPQAAEKDIDFSLDCTGILHKAVYGDQEKIKQLVMYLTNNAVTYTKPGGKVAITAVELEELPNQYANFQLVVEDTGIGISEDFLERIFEPFSREKNTTLSGIHGIGLGLTITKNLVDMMGGTIDIKSKVGEGSTFTVTLRFRIQPQITAGDSGLDGTEAQPDKMRILLVEDNEINLEIETEILEELGFLIEPAVDGSIAVEKVKSAAPGQYQIILMDIQMPVMDGWQAAEAIRRLPDPAQSHIPIIALSANIFDSDIRKSVECGMDAHLPKPLDISLLLETIEKVIKKKPQAT